MQCPRCKNTSTDVTNSRTIQDGKAVRRRRECSQCNYRFSTLEVMKVLDIKVEKRNGRIELYDELKLEKGIKKAFNKRNVDPIKIEKIVSEINEEVLKLNKKTIKSTKIGRIVLRVLKRQDEAAYICFWAMFGDFESSEDFMALLKEFGE